MVNYYELLEVAKDANEATIKQAIRKTRRIWNNRANSPDASVRAEAELHVKEVADAERILLDPAERKEYNIQLSQAPEPDPTNQKQNETSDSKWEDEFFKAYNNDLYDYAIEVAQQVIRLNKNDGRAWFLYGEALRRGGNVNKGIEALRRASLLLRDDQIYRQLGFAYTEVNQYDKAREAFGVASQIKPKSAEYHALIASCFRIEDQIKNAVSSAKKAYSLNAKDKLAQFEYFLSLYEEAKKSVSYNRSSGKHLIINKRQLDYVGGLLETMSKVIPQNDKNCEENLSEITKIVEDAKKYKKGGLFGMGQPGYKYNYKMSNEDMRSTGLSDYTKSSKR